MKARLLLIAPVGLAILLGGCSSPSEVSTQDVKDKEAQINAASAKLPPSSTHADDPQR